MAGAGVLPWAVGAFAVTNLDDLLMLTLFFAGRTRQNALRVVLGHYLGFTVILGGSILLGLAGSLVPGRWIALLGLVPLLLGVRDAVRLWRTRKDDAALPLERSAKSVFEIASVTVANGGDNLAVYVPAFALLGWKRSAAVAAVFYAMVAVWCLLGWMLVRHRAVVQVADQMGHIVLPLALIAVGLLILRGVF